MDFFFPNKHIGQIFWDVWQFEKTQMNHIAKDTEKIKKKLGMSWMHKTYVNINLSLGLPW